MKGTLKYIKGSSHYFVIILILACFLANNTLVYALPTTQQTQSTLRPINSREAAAEEVLSELSSRKNFPTEGRAKSFLRRVAIVAVPIFAIAVITTLGIKNVDETFKRQATDRVEYAETIFKDKYPLLKLGFNSEDELFTFVLKNKDFGYDEYTGYVVINDEGKWVFVIDFKGDEYGVGIGAVGMPGEVKSLWQNQPQPSEETKRFIPVLVYMPSFEDIDYFLTPTFKDIPSRIIIMPDESAIKLTKIEDETEGEKYKPFQDILTRLSTLSKQYAYAEKIDSQALLIELVMSMFEDVTGFYETNIQWLLNEWSVIARLCGFKAENIRLTDSKDAVERRDAYLSIGPEEIADILSNPSPYEDRFGKLEAELEEIGATRFIAGKRKQRTQRREKMAQEGALEGVSSSGLIGKLFNDKGVHIKEGVIAEEEDGFLVFYHMEEEEKKPLYAKDHRQAKVELTDKTAQTPDGIKIRYIKDHPYIKGFANKDCVYVSRGLSAAVERIIAQHEMWHNYYDRYPEKLPEGLNAHTLSRGGGKDMRNLLEEAIAKGELRENCTAAQLVGYIQKQFLEGKLPISRYNPAEIALIWHNRNASLLGEEEATGRRLLYGLQDWDENIGYEANRRFTQSISTKTAVPKAVLSPGNIEQFMQLKDKSSGSYLLARGLVRLLADKGITHTKIDGYRARGERLTAEEVKGHFVPGRAARVFRRKPQVASGAIVVVYILSVGNRATILAGDPEKIKQYIRSGGKESQILNELPISFSIQFKKEDSSIYITKPNGSVVDRDTQKRVLDICSGIFDSPDVGFKQIPIRTKAHSLDSIESFLYACSDDAFLAQDNEATLFNKPEWLFALREAGIINDEQLQELSLLCHSSKNRPEVLYAVANKTFEWFTEQERLAYSRFVDDFADEDQARRTRFENTYMENRQQYAFMRTLRDIIAEAKRENGYSGSDLEYILYKLRSCGRTAGWIQERQVGLTNRANEIDGLLNARRSKRDGKIVEVGSRDAAGLNTEIGNIQRELSPPSAKQESLTQQLEKKKNRLKAELHHKADLIKQLDEQGKDTIAKLENTIKTADEEITDLITNIENIAGQLSPFDRTMEAQRVALYKKIQDAQNRLDEAKKQLPTRKQKLADLKESVRVMEERLGGLVGRRKAKLRKEKEREYGKLLKKQEDAKNAILKAENDIAFSPTEIEVAEKELKAFDDMKERQRKALAERHEILKRIVGAAGNGASLSVRQNTLAEQGRILEELLAREEREKLSAKKAKRNPIDLGSEVKAIEEKLASFVNEIDTARDTLNAQMEAYRTAAIEANGLRNRLDAELAGAGTKLTGLKNAKKNIEFRLSRLGDVSENWQERAELNMRLRYLKKGIEEHPATIKHLGETLIPAVKKERGRLQGVRLRIMESLKVLKKREAQEPTKLKKQLDQLKRCLGVKEHIEAELSKEGLLWSEENARGYIKNQKRLIEQEEAKISKDEERDIKAYDAEQASYITYLKLLGLYNNWLDDYKDTGVAGDELYSKLEGLVIERGAPPPYHEGILAAPEAVDTITGERQITEELAQSA